MKAEEILDKHHRLNDKCLLGIAMDSQQRTSILNAMEEYAALMLTESQREAKRMRVALKEIKFVRGLWGVTNQLDHCIKLANAALSNQPGDEKREG